jgi:glyoxylase-like metal-dependent hydrolase (beta-lactamase superfamily II)
MVRQILPYLFEVSVRLMGSPLKSLNSYVIKGDGRNLLVDTGFNQKESFEDLTTGIRELALDMRNTDIFLTHFHADHTGLVSAIASPSSKIYMGAADIPLFAVEHEPGDTYWTMLREMFLKTGFPENEYNDAMRVSPIRVFAAPKKINCIPLVDGDAVSVGDFYLKCVLTPGHTPGHLCLYYEKDKVMFLGDHVLFDITPNITVRIAPSNPLKEYLDSLEKIKQFDVKIALSAHRKNGSSLQLRVEELHMHHKKRLQEVTDIVAANPGISGYEVASHMIWSIRANSWEEFPAIQKWFAVAEAIAHLEYLIMDGCVGKDDIDTKGIDRYRSTDLSLPK